METVIKTAEAKQKLTNGGIMSGHIDEFCRVLAIRLKDETTPLNLLMAIELLISDVEKAPGREIPGFGTPAIPSYIAGLPLGNIIRMMQEKIIRHAFPADFANEVVAELNGVRQDADDFAKASREGRW